jgi:hypothetical protein
MYQSLIWPAVLGDDPRRLRAALDSEDLKRLADALVDGVRRDSELGGDFLGTEMLVDETEAIELAAGQASDPLRDRVVRCASRNPPIVIWQAVRFVQSNPHLAQHRATPEQRVRETLGHPHGFRQIFSGFAPNRGESALTLVIGGASPETFRGESSSRADRQIALELHRRHCFGEVMTGD